MEPALDAFERAAQAAKNLPRRPDNNTLLKLYALFKQGTQGDVDGPEPNPFDFVGRAKYEAWSKIQGMTRQEARSHYIALVEQLNRPE
jgi:acyl-CoA-binding protein